MENKSLRFQHVFQNKSSDPKNIKWENNLLDLAKHVFN